MTRLLNILTPLGRGLVRKKLLLSSRSVQPLMSPAFTLARLQFLLMRWVGSETATLLMQLTIMMRPAYSCRQGPGYAMNP